MWQVDFPFVGNLLQRISFCVQITYYFIALDYIEKDWNFVSSWWMVSIRWQMHFQIRSEPPKQLHCGHLFLSYLSYGALYHFFRVKIWTLPLIVFQPFQARKTTRRLFLDPKKPFLTSGMLGTSIFINYVGLKL